MVYTKKDICVVIPVFNEAETIIQEVAALQRNNLHNIVVAVSYRTDDETIPLLRKNAIPFVISLKDGYDSAAMAGIDALRGKFSMPHIVMFTDAGGKYNYECIEQMLGKINDGADLVLGKREERKSYMLWHQRLGTYMVLLPIRLFYRKKIADISPLRLICYQTLKSLHMQPATYRWTTEMLIKCLSKQKKIVEIPVSLHRRKGYSKVSGNLKNSLRAGWEMMSAYQFMFLNTYE